MMTNSNSIDFLLRCADAVISKDELKKRILSKKKLNLKLGVDPTAPELHLGHMVILKALRRFQDHGHNVQIVIGGFTALVGDPSGKKATRPVLTSAEIKKKTKIFISYIFVYSF